jgi:hypothetical protein
MSALEAATNAIVGLLVSWAAVHALWPLMGWPVTGRQAAGVSLFFFILSFARAWALREVFRRWAS